MRVLGEGDEALHVVETGPADGPALLLLHALGTDLRLWEGLVARLPAGLRIVRMDLRGHGLSACPPGPYPMGKLVTDAERVTDALGLRDVVVLGISLGGLIAQGLAVKRSELLRGLVLSNTAAKIGTADQWQDRIAAARAGGLAAMVEGTLERWFPEPFRSGPEAAAIRRMFLRQPLEGWAGCAAAIAGTDFLTPVSTLQVPTLAIAADRDGSTPPDLVRETAEAIPGARLHLIRGAGHLPLIDAPEAYAEALGGFLAELGAV